MCTLVRTGRSAVDARVRWGLLDTVARSVQGVRWGSICEHGRVRSRKECGGGSIPVRSSALRTAAGLKSASTVVGAISARSGGGAICEHGCQRYSCKERGGSGICEHGRRRYQCKDRGAHLEHARRRSRQGLRWWWNLRARSSASNCKECVVWNLRARPPLSVQGVRGHRLRARRQRSHCEECGGAVCSTVVPRCKECGGSEICEHGRRRYQCKSRGSESAARSPPRCRSVAPRINERRDESAGRYSTQYSTQRGQQTSDRVGTFHFTSASLAPRPPNNRDAPLHGPGSVRPRRLRAYAAPASRASMSPRDGRYRNVAHSIADNPYIRSPTLLRVRPTRFLQPSPRRRRLMSDE